MASKSNIEWTGHTWNPLAGCSVLTSGCKRCYAMRLAKRLGAMGNPLYAGLTKDSNGGAVWTGEMRKAPRHTLMEPLRRKKPTTYFVNSMSDLFHENVPDEWIDEIFAVMALCPQHTFQVLTKRAARMRDYFADEHQHLRFAQAGGRLMEDGDNTVDTLLYEKYPLPNVWLGVSTERQQEADERIPLLLKIPAAVRFISAEPLLGPVNLMMLKVGDKVYDAVQGFIGTDIGDGEYDGAEPCNKLDWVIVGGESGHGYRPMQEEWARGILAQCAASGTAAFMKQMAGKKPIPADMLVREFPVAA